jgi:hypothetical protein
VLATGAAGALWRWRLELVLLALPAAAWSLLAGPLGGFAAAAVVAWIVAVLVVVPGSPGAAAGG